MEEKDQIPQGFSLEDILKEFGASEEETEQTPAEQTEPESVPETAPQPREDMDITRVIPVVTGDTVRLEDVSKAVAAQHTDLDQTRSFTPVEEPAAEEKKPEPFTGDWEPDYEQPIGEYVPPQPIVFHPRSRLRELKRKLVAGPERRYYELSEQGVGKLQGAMFICMIVVALSAGATVMYELGLVQEDRLKLMIFGQFFALLVSALLGCYQLMDGVGDLFKGKFSLNTLLVFTFIVCCADGVFCLQEQRIPCCAAFSLQMTMSLWNSYHKRTTEMAQMDTMRKATHLDSLSAKQDYYEGRPGILRGEGQVEDFMDTYSKPSFPDKVLSGYAIAVLLISVGAGIMAYTLHGLSAAFQAAAVTMLAAAPASIFVTVSRPMAILQKRLHSLGTVLCGWQGVRELGKKVVFPLEHDDLFPAGAAKMNGVKFYGRRDPDQVVAYTTAIISANGGGLVNLFEQLLDSRNGRHYEVENLRAYGGGVGGEVCGEPVLVGVLSFMKDMGVEIPDGIRVNQAVYAAIDGELCGLYAISYEKVHASAAGVRTLCSYRGMKNVLVSGDFMLTESFIRSKFGVRSRRIVFPALDVREELRDQEPEENAPALALMTQEGLASMAFAVTGSRTLRTACALGVGIHILAGVLGLAMMLVLTWFGAFELLTPANMFAYELLWMVPGLLITEWTRHV